MTGGWDVFSNEFLLNVNYHNLALARTLVKWNYG